MVLSLRLREENTLRIIKRLLNEDEAIELKNQPHGADRTRSLSLICQLNIAGRMCIYLFIYLYVNLIVSTHISRIPISDYHKKNG